MTFSVKKPFSSITLTTYLSANRATKNSSFIQTAKHSRRMNIPQMEGPTTINVLVVDDDSVTQMIHQKLLNRYGLESEAVNNGKEAVDLFTAGKTFDLVLMDKEMPVMDGPEATRKLKEMGVKSMIVGVTTANKVEQERKDFMEAGLDDCYDKPLTPKAVIAVLDELAKRLL